MTGRARRRGDAGLTLIEVLVVLAIVGVATGAAMLGVNAAGRTTLAQTEAVRLARSLTLGADEAMFAQAPLAVLWDASGYRFVQWSESGGWTATASRFLTERHDLPNGLSMQLASGTTGQSAAPVMIRAGGLGPVTTFTLDGADIRWVVDFDSYSAVARAEVAP